MPEGWGGLTEGEPGSQAGARPRLSLSRRGSPGNVLQLHLFRVACLTEHPEQFQDYISLSHLFARGVSQTPEVSRPAAPRSPGHARRGPHSLGPHAQGPPGDTRSTPGAAGQSGHTTHSVHTQTQSPGIGAVPAHNAPTPFLFHVATQVRPARLRDGGPSHTHAGTHTNTDTHPQQDLFSCPASCSRPLAVITTLVGERI